MFTFDSSYIRPGPFEIATIPVGRLSFNLTNRVNNYFTTCSVANQDYMNYLYSETELDVWYDCASVAPDQWTESAPPDIFKERPEYKITTFVRFYKLTGQLSVNQTWYCDKDPQNTYVPCQACSPASLSVSWRTFLSAWNSGRTPPLC